MGEWRKGKTQADNARRDNGSLLGSTPSLPTLLCVSPESVASKSLARETIVVFGDPHGDEICPLMRASLMGFLKEFKPRILVNAGDNFNFSHIRGKATPKERDTSSAEDWRIGSEFFLEAMSHGKRRYFLRGNHDERLWDVRANAMDSDRREAADEGIRKIEAMARRRNTQMLPYHSGLGVLDVDGLRVIHGYASGVGAARKFASVYGSCAYAHTHSMDVAPVERWPEPSVAYGTGCLMQIEQGYNSRNIGKLRHENGWLYGFVKDGRAVYFQAKQHADKTVYASTNFQGF